MTHATIESHVRLLNHVFELEKKISGRDDASALLRIVNRMKTQLAELGFEYADPLGEPYNMMRTDCEASIAGDASGELVITDVVKPIVWRNEEGQRYIVQKAVVIAEPR